MPCLTGSYNAAFGPILNVGVLPSGSASRAETAPEMIEFPALLELKLRLAHAIRTRRTRANLTQAQLARRIRSSGEAKSEPRRVAKIEAGDPSVSLDLLNRTHLAHGATHADLAKTIRTPAPRP